MKFPERLHLWDPDESGFPDDLAYIFKDMFWAKVVKFDKDYPTYLRALMAELASPRNLQIFEEIAARHQVPNDEEGRLFILHSILLTGLDREIKCARLTQRLYISELSGDVEGQTATLKEMAYLDPLYLDGWLKLIAHMKKYESPAAILECIRPGERFQRRDLDFRWEKLRLICACGSREEALAEGRRIREDIGEWAELLIQADEDFMLAWRTDQDAVEFRGRSDGGDDSSIQGEENMSAP